MLDSINTYNGLSFTEYLKAFEKEFQKGVSLDNLSSYLSADNAYQTEKPYLYRRIIKSTDQRFESFEIVYNKSEKIKAIIFNVGVKLSELHNLFGQDFMKNEPYSNSTAFIFSSINSDIEIIMSRYPKWLTKQNGSKYDFVIDDTTDKIIDPKFNFVQFDIKQ